jgi:cytochrome P450
LAINSAPVGPRGHRLRGHLPGFMRDRTGFLNQCAREYGDLVPLRFGPRRAVLVSNPFSIADVFVDRSKNFVKPYILRTDRLRMGDTRLGDEGDFWRRQRLAQPAFHRTRLDEYGETMVATTQEMLGTWRDGERRDILAEMNRLTLQIAARSLFGTDLADQAEAVGAALQAVMDGFIPRLGALFLVPDWLPTPANRRLRQALRELDETMDGIVARRRALGDERNDLLSLLLRAADEGVLTDRQVREHATTYLLAGHETTALVLSWAWHLLGTHLQAAAKLTDEVDAVLGERAATTADVPRLKYAERVALESMRLYPPIWAMARVALRDDELGGHAIRGGTVVIVSPWVMHRDPRYYAAPEAFEPDRWADEAMKHLPRYAYFPFGGGPRGCIGSRFATQEAVLLLATIAQRYRLTPVPGQKVVPVPSITLRPSNGVPMVVRARVGG